MSSPEVLLEAACEELRGLAGRFVRERPGGETLQPTAPVREAYLRLARRSPDDGPWESRAHFFAVAAEAMRQVLANHARDPRALPEAEGPTTRQRWRSPFSAAWLRRA